MALSICNRMCSKINTYTITCWFGPQNMAANFDLRTNSSRNLWVYNPAKHNLKTNQLTYNVQ